MSDQPELLDLVIIGAAAAGCTAAIYAARRKLNFVVVSKDIGGEVALSGDVENWPGTNYITGFDLAQNFYKHAQSYGVQFEEGFEVTGISQEKNYHVVQVKDYAGNTKEYKTISVIIASGIHPRELGIPGEKELKNKGVTSCTVCDGPLYKNKITATIGSGNSALESALMMAGIAQKTYLISKYPESEMRGFPKGEAILIDKVKEKKTVEIIYNANTTHILGEQKVTGLVYVDQATGEEKTLQIDGAMVHVGMIPNSQFVTSIEKNAAGEIKASVKTETSCKGIFAAGDVTDIPYKQISISSGQGATAALAAIEYINRWSA